MPLGDLAREDEYGDPLIPPPVNPLTGEGLPGFSGKQMSEGMRRGAQNLGLTALPDPRDTFSNAIYGVKFPGEFMRRGAQPEGPTEADQLRADLMNKAATDWGVKTGASVALDPVPAALALARGLPLRSSTTFGAGAGQGIKAYHSSPHDFEKFDFSKIGTGEGAQVYGHGGYFAENPAVSGQGGQYWSQFLGRFKGSPEAEAATLLYKNKFDRSEAVKEAERLAVIWNDQPRRDTLKLLESGKPVGPRTYEVNIKTDPEQLLDWDKRLREQPEAIRQALQQRVPDLSENFPGAQFYNSVAAKYGSEGRPHAAAALRDAGIPGIRYLDAGSRRMSDEAIRSAIAKNNADIAYLKKSGDDIGIMGLSHRNELLAEQLKKPQTSNYVMFPGTENMIDILKKYGVAGTAPLGALAAQDQYRD
jgi:hypothetical protein